MGLRLGLREWGQRELWAGLGGALGLASQSSSEASLSDWFSSQFDRPALLLNSASSGLQIALELLAMQSPHRDEVVLPALACPALTKVIKAAGLQPVYVDIDKELNIPAQALQQGLGQRSLAVIMVHAYGHPANSEGIQAICQQQGVALIDDSAQRIDPDSGMGKSGDFGLFSFAQSKNVVCGIDGSGGVLLINSPRYLRALETRWRDLPQAHSRRLAWLEFALTPSAPKVGYYVGRIRSRLGGKTKVPARIGAVDAAIAIPQLATLDTRRQMRKKLLHQYHLAFRQFGIEAPQLERNTRYLARLLVRIRPDVRERCRQALAAEGIASRLPYRLPASISETAYPQAALSAAELLELPLPACWTAQDIHLAARIVAPFCASARLEH